MYFSHSGDTVGVSQNKTKVGLKFVNFSALAFFAICQNKTKVGLKSIYEAGADS